MAYSYQPKETIRIEIKMDRRNEVFEDLIPDPKQPSFDEYFKQFKASFLRIWANKFLWFWGMFLPGSVGVGFSVDKQFERLSSKEIVNWQLFVLNNLEQLCFIFGIIFLFGIFVWCISAISRSGVIQVLACLRNPKNKKKLNFGMVWSSGKKNFKKILLLDFFVGMVILVTFLILLVPVAIMILMDNQAGAIFLFITLIIFFFLFVVFMNYILQIATIYLVLANVEIFGAITVAIRLITKNLLEVFKLFSIFFLIGLLQGAVFLFVIAIIAPFWGKIVSLWLSFYASSSVEWILFSSFIIIISIMLLLLAKSIFSLWIQEIWLWWVEEVGGNKNEDEEEVFLYKERPGIANAVVRKNSLACLE